MMFYAKRPSDGPVVWNNQRGGLMKLFTRVGRMTKNERAAVRTAKRHSGRVYAYDGAERLVHDFSEARPC